MPLSSLIFVVILAVWAVYLVQHWVRRRDHLATARSVDRFSESMRVLERRRALPRPDLSEPAPRSYSVSPLRPARPEVVVKRVPAGATAVSAPRSVRRARTAARLRFGGLLLGTTTMVTLVALALAKILPPWASLVGVTVMAACVAVVRLSTRGSSAKAGAARPVRRPEARTAPSASASRDAAPAAAPAARAASSTRTAAPAARATRRVVEPVARPAAQGDLETQVAPSAPAAHAFARQSVAATTRTARRTVSTAQLYDVDRVEAEARVSQPDPARSVTEVALPPVADAPVVGEPAAASGTWDPVPVPRPTYTMKAKAYRPGLAPTELPADGTEMALDEEFEDLPRIESVG